jgi:hypothetical protein
VSRCRFLPYVTPFRLLAHSWIDGVWHLDLRARRRSAACPGCRHRSTAVHRSYRSRCGGRRTRVSRSSAGIGAEGIRHGAPQAVQVVDRFHLVQNLGEALEWFFLISMWCTKE